MGRNKNGKVTWRMIHKDFESYYPRLSKNSCYWAPYDYAQIIVYINNGKRFVYDYDVKMGCYIPGDWNNPDDWKIRMEHVQIDMVQKVHDKLVEPYVTYKFNRAK